MRCLHIAPPTGSRNPDVRVGAVVCSAMRCCRGLDAATRTPGHPEDSVMVCRDEPGAYRFRVYTRRRYCRFLTLFAVQEIQDNRLQGLCWLQLQMHQILQAPGDNFKLDRQFDSFLNSCVLMRTKQCCPILEEISTCPQTSL